MTIQHCHKTVKFSTLLFEKCRLNLDYMWPGHVPTRSFPAVTLDGAADATSGNRIPGETAAPERKTCELHYHVYSTTNSIGVMELSTRKANGKAHAQKLNLCANDIMRNTNCEFQLSAQ